MSIFPSLVNGVINAQVEPFFIGIILLAFDPIFNDVVVLGRSEVLGPKAKASHKITRDTKMVLIFKFIFVGRG